MKNPTTDFAPIEGDFEFYVQHSTESESTIRDYRRHLRPFAERDGLIRILDFGCGRGQFAAELLRDLAWPPSRVRVSLVEPVETHRLRAVERLRRLSLEPPKHAASLSELDVEESDVILCNHVLYYVPDLEAVVTSLVERLASSGRMLATLLGRDNGMYRFWKSGFAQLNGPVPYWVAEDLEAILSRLGLDFHKETCRYVLAFPDSPANRLRILRFLFAHHLADMRQDELSRRFDPLAQDGRVALPTHSTHFIIPGQDVAHIPQTKRTES